MIHVSISEEIAKACPDLHVAVVECDVVNTVSDEQLWNEITEVETHIRTTCKLEDINKFPPIQATRQAYKRLGKDPNRYRPSAEALRRRILRELPLYKIDTLVDIINLLSIQSGYSIGGFDAGIDMNTGKLLMIINGYSGKEGLQEALTYGVSLLTRYVSTTNLEMELITPESRVKIML